MARSRTSATSACRPASARCGAWREIGWTETATWSCGRKTGRTTASALHPPTASRPRLGWLL
eukprot:7809932-Prorocentrum_lima.AAC.1